MTNLRSTCQETGPQIVSTVTFDVVAQRREAGPARQVVLPYFNTVVRGGDQVVAKQVGYVALNFAEGSLRAQTSGQATATVDPAAAALPADIEDKLTRERKPGDPEAAIDPMTDPAVRAAVAQATFEQLVGFQLSEGQLRYNVTR
jgi:regulator of protease activity HflC (stomatin/prohibitin superfamily)